MKRISYLILSLIIVSSANSLFAQAEKSEITVKGQLRPRAEYRHGALSPISEGQKASSFISNRARINIGYDNGFLSMGFGAQDVSVWGEKPQIDPNPWTSGINEAWAKIYKNGYFAQFGRQQLAYDDDRILGTLDWNQAGRYHDALKLGYEGGLHKAHIILAYNQRTQGINSGTYYTGNQPYKTMQTAWYKYDYRPNSHFSLLFMNLGMEAGTPATEDAPAVSKTKSMQTIGANISHRLNDLNLSGSAYYQMGKNTSDRSINAYMFAAKAQYVFTPSFSAAIGIDYLSGQDDSDKATNFDPLYGTHHKFYGSMDYFYASSFGNKGLSDLYASIIFKPVGALSVDLTYHNFSSQQDILVDDVSKRGLGSEIDLTITYPIRPYITLQGGYSMMFGTDAFFQIKGGSKDKTQNWAFLSLNVNPTIFSSRNK